jgi:tetratricopeptide (TPR) repeat protein
MNNAVAERSYSKGLESVTRGDFLSGLAYFEAAMELARKIERTNPPPRYLSFYGLCLAMVSTKLQTGLEMCERAVAIEFYNPDLFHNLARVHLRMGRRDRAHAMLVRGLHLNPAHQGILSDLRRMGLRRRPFLPFLSRSNPLNRLLGRMLREPSRPILAS